MVLPRVPPLSPAGPEEILRPAEPWFIMFTLFVALLGNLLPLSGMAEALKPDFLALVLLYWCIQEPRYVGVGAAWFLGLVMDVSDATLFGQHALAYAVLAYAAEYFRRRVLRFPLWQQAVQVALLLALCAGLVLLIRVVRRSTSAIDVRHAAACRRASVALVLGRAAMAAAAEAVAVGFMISASHMHSDMTSAPTALRHGRRSDLT